MTLIRRCRTNDVMWCVVDCCGDVRIDKALSASLSYWLQISLRDIDEPFIGHHWDLINAIVPVYDRFVHHGACLNRTLKEEFEVSYNFCLYYLSSKHSQI